MSVLLAILYFAVAVALHAVWCRASARPSVVVKFVGIGGLCGLALLAHLWSLNGATTGTLAGLLVFALASELYIFCFTLIISSVSAIWLRRLFRSPIDRSALAETYSPAWMVDSRMVRLIENGFLVKTERGYEITEKGRSLIASFTRLRAVFNHPPRS